MKYITIGGSDPGKNNSAFSVVKVLLEDPTKYKVVETGMVQHVIRDLTTDPMKQAHAYRREMLKLVKKHDIDVFVVERFQNRGRFSGNTGELVSMMIGMLFGLPLLDVKVITAAQWKNAFNRVGDLEQLYQDSSLVAHRIDAAAIAMYGASYYLARPPFEFISGSGQRKFGAKLDRTK